MAWHHWQNGKIRVILEKKIAVLLASYNGTRWIKEQVDSILNQKDVTVTLFISDDLSMDGTLEYLQNIYPKNERLVYLASVEKFGGAAKNFYRLIKNVDFEEFDYIALSDQDDIWHEEKLSRAISSIKERKADAYSSNVTAFWEDARELILDKAQPQTSYDYLFEAAGPGCTYVLSKKLALDFQSFLCENFFEASQISLHDWLIYAFSRANGYLWYIDSRVSVRYRQHLTNEVGANSGIKAKIKRLKLVFSSWYRNETIKIIKVLQLQTKCEFSKYIIEKNYINNLLLLKYAFLFRRKTKERVFLALLILFGIY